MAALQPDQSQLTNRGGLYVVDAFQVAHEITDVVTEVSLNYTLDAGTELTINIADQDRKMLLGQYFNLAQLFIYDGTPYQISSISVAQGDGSIANISLKMLEYKFQQMKQDFHPEVYRSANGFIFAQKVANKYGLLFEGQPVKGKQETIKVKSKRNRESVWAVLQRSASDNQYMCFIANNTLFFASPKALIGRWGIDEIAYVPEWQKTNFRYVPLVYPTPPSEKRFFLTEMPSVQRSLDSRKEAEGSAQILGPNARQLRAGMTVMLYGMSDDFDSAYLITSVDYQDRSTEPVQLNFANISKLAPEDKKKINQKIREVTVITGGYA